MAVNTLLPEPLLNPRLYSTLHNDAVDSSISDANMTILKAHESATAATIAEGTASAGSSTAAALLQIARIAAYEEAISTAGLTRDEAIPMLNPVNTPVPVYINVDWTGSATLADVNVIVSTYVNQLAAAGDVVAATLTTALDADDDITVTILELDSAGTPLRADTGNVTIDAAEIAQSVSANVNEAVLVYVDVNIDGTILEAAAETIVLDYLDTLAVGEDIDHSALVALILADGSVTAVNSVKIDFTSTPVPEVDLVIPATQIARASAASITFTDAD